MTSVAKESLSYNLYFREEFWFLTWAPHCIDMVRMVLAIWVLMSWEVIVLQANIWEQPFVSGRGGVWFVSVHLWQKESGKNTEFILICVIALNLSQSLSRNLLWCLISLLWCCSRVLGLLPSTELSFSFPVPCHVELSTLPGVLWKSAVVPGV